MNFERGEIVRYSHSYISWKYRYLNS